MTHIRVEVATEFRGQTVVLVAMDLAGLEAFAAAMTAAEQAGSARLSHCGIVQHIVVRAGRADVELHDTRVEWSLDYARTAEIVEKLSALQRSGRPGHHYVDDFGSPAETVVLSVGEYV